MKRKRGKANQEQTVPPAVSSNKAVSNASCVNAKDQTGLGGFVDATSGSRKETEIPQGHSNFSGWQVDPNQLRLLIRSIVKDVAEGTANKSSKGFASSANSPINSASLLRPRSERIHKENSRVTQDPSYKEQELKAALSVVKKIMKLDAAVPFNVPVDPIALGIPDYFDVIDTPMDFGTICNNLEKGLKYMSSEDVYKDVQCIWDNCCKYNKKGDLILELMNRVKISFMKHWTAAGLYKAQEQPIDGFSNLQTPAQSTMRTSGKMQNHTTTNINNSNQLLSVPCSSYLHQEPELFSPQPQSSLQHLAVDTDEEIMPSSPPTESSSGHSKSGEQRPEGFVTNSTFQKQNNSIRQVQVHQSSSGHGQACQPELGSNQLHHLSEDDEMEPPIMKKRRGRGPARCLKLLTRVGRPVIDTNCHGEPTGPDAALLRSYIGVLARNGHLAPLTYEQWNKVPDDYKEKMWLKVQKKFEIDPKSRSWVLKFIGGRWKSFKAVLKATRYDVHTTDEERLVDRDKRVLPDQWPILIQQWNSEEWQHMSAVNKANRAKVKHLHTAGTKSFSRICEEEKAKRPDGKEPSRAELFILTHTRKDGQPINDEAAAVISQLRNCSNEQQENDVLNQVMGQGKNSRPTLANTLRMVTEANAEIHDIKEKMGSMEKMCSQMATQMATMMSMIASMQKTSPATNVSNAAISANAAEEGLQKQPLGTSLSRPVASPRQLRARKKR